MSLPTTETNCFSNIIGLRGLCDDSTIPDSGLYLNELGISVNELNDFLTEDYPDADTFFRKQKDFAIEIITKQIHSSLQSKYKAATVLENQRIGFFQENLSIQSGITNYFKGIHVELNNQDSFLDFFLNSISIQLHTATTLSVYVIDLIQGVIIDTISVDTLADEIVTKYVNKKYKSDRKVLNLFIGYDSTGVSSNNTVSYNGGRCKSCRAGYYKNGFASYNSAKLSTAAVKIIDNLEDINETGGLSINYNVSCNNTDWLCSVSNVIAMPVLYKTAALIIGWGIRNSSNEQFNTRNIINVDKLKERESNYEFSFREQMDNMMKDINVPSDERCFVCRERSRTAVMLP